MLVTLNSTYQHAAFGLRYLFANLGELQSRAEILEFTIERNPRDIAEEILARRPKLVGFGVYIWNTKQTFEVISCLKKIAPELTIVLGGPEVSYESESQSICQISDYVIKGEADFLFRELAENLLLKNDRPSQKFISGALPDINTIQTPYEYYSDNDIQNRIIYVEASRGCPYKCEYCLSSLDKSVRNFPLEPFLKNLGLLIEKGARQFKFIDRTFNLSPSISGAILQFFLDRIELGLFLHFEMVPDRLPLELKELIAKFPKGSLQFEIGIQTWNPEVAKLVSRRNDYIKVRENFKFLVHETGVHIHADLIAGLPGEDMISFGKGFDELVALNPHEIQVGILKRLKGTPIIRHDQQWKMIYQDFQPFQVLSTATMSFQELQQIGRFSKFWDLIANSGQFAETINLMKQLSNKQEDPSFFKWFFEFSQYLASKYPQSHSIALLNLFKSSLHYLTEQQGVAMAEAIEVLGKDYSQNGRRELPHFLRGFTGPSLAELGKAQRSSSVPQRQRNHLLSNQGN